METWRKADLVVDVEPLLAYTGDVLSETIVYGEMYRDALSDRDCLKGFSGNKAMRPRRAYKSQEDQETVLS